MEEGKGGMGLEIRMMAGCLPFELALALVEDVSVGQISGHPAQRFEELTLCRRL